MTAWGKIIATTGSLANTVGANQPFRYRGYVYDEETGWYYLQSRYYDPNTCRFISADVYLSTGQGVIGHNSFAYCLNNPVNRTDASGAFSLKNVIDFIRALLEGGGGGAGGHLWCGRYNHKTDEWQDGTRSNKSSPKWYYQDKNGRWHRPNGQYASYEDIGIPSTGRIASSTHGNSLNYPGVNYGYALVDIETGEILKFGETIRPANRYTKSFLLKNNARMVILTSGTKRDIHYWQYDMNNYFKYRYGVYPVMELSKTGW